MRLPFPYNIYISKQNGVEFLTISIRKCWAKVEVFDSDKQYNGKKVLTDQPLNKTKEIVLIIVLQLLNKD